MFLSHTRPIGQFHLQTNRLIKTYRFTDGIAWDGLPAKQLQQAGFQSDFVKWVLYDRKKKAGGFWWDYLPRTSDELDALRRSFAVLGAEQQRKEEGTVTIERKGDRINFEVEAGCGSDMMSAFGGVSPRRARSMLLKSARKLGPSSIDWEGKIDKAIAD